MEENARERSRTLVERTKSYVSLRRASLSPRGPSKFGTMFKTESKET